MKEIASLAFDAGEQQGYDQAGMEYCDSFIPSDSYHLTKEQFINNLFNQ